MAMSHRDVIDFPALERELQAALESERRYVRENEAKLRAVSQRVGSYNEFRYEHPGSWKLFQEPVDWLQSWKLVLALSGNLESKLFFVVIFSVKVKNKRAAGLIGFLIHY